MNDYYSKNPRFYVGIDCIIFGFDKKKLSLLILQRNFEPAKGEWSLMGGFVQEGESADEAAKRVLQELTGLKSVYMEQVGAFGEVHRDPGERVISLAYYALIDINAYDHELVHQHNAHWVDVNELPHLIFDHNQMVEKAPLDRGAKSRYHGLCRGSSPPAQVNISGTQVRPPGADREVG